MKSLLSILALGAALSTTAGVAAAAQRNEVTRLDAAIDTTLARRGADDAAGDDRGGRGRGKDDGANHARRGRGADDGAAHQRRGRGQDDGPNHT